MNFEETKRIAVLGGGICGLSAAFWLRRILPTSEIHLFEASVRCGGVIGTVRRGDLLLETGPLAFPANAPATSDLLAAAGHGDLMGQARSSEGVGIWQGRRIAQVSRTPLGILRARMLSFRCMARLIGEPFISPSDSEDESVRDFFRRRTGDGFLATVVEPLCSAIHAGDPEVLGMEANYPEWRAWERGRGRMAWALWKQVRARKRESDGTKGLAGGPQGNGPVIQALTGALRKMGVRFHLGDPVQGVAREDGDGIRIETDAASEIFDACVSCLRAPDIGRAFARAPSEVREFLSQVPYASVSLAYLSYRKDETQDGFRGSHCLVPSRTWPSVLSLSIPSRMQAGRCGKGRELVRVSMGGMREPAICSLSDAALRGRAEFSAARILNLRGPTEDFVCLRQPQSLPQLLVGHRKRLESARERLAMEFPNFILSGTATVGAGIEKAAQEGKRAAFQVAARLGCEDVMGALGRS